MRKGDLESGLELRFLGRVALVLKGGRLRIYIELREPDKFGEPFWLDKVSGGEESGCREAGECVGRSEVVCRL
jgi:hypothetical protein